MKTLLALLYILIFLQTAWAGLEESPNNQAYQSVAEQNSRCSLPEIVSDQTISVDWHLTYRWCEIITEKAVAYGFDPALIAAIIHIESRGREDAYSHSGAVGLMQVMPSDGIAATNPCQCFWDRPTTQQLLVPEFNIDTGSSILSGKLDYYQDMREALKHYGPVDYGYVYADMVLDVYKKITQADA